MKFKVMVDTIRLNPHVVTTKLVEITVSSTMVLGNVVYSKINNYANGVIEEKGYNNKEEIDLIITDTVGMVSYESNLTSEEEKFISNLYDQAKITYFN